MTQSSPKTFQDAFFQKHPGAFSVMDLFEYLPNASFYAKDTESRFVKANHAFVLNHGVQTEEEILGKNDRDFHPPAFAEAYITEDKRVMAGRKAIPGQLWMVFHPGQQPHWYISTKAPLFDSENQVIGIAGVMYSIKESSEKARYFGALQSVIRHMEEHYGDRISMDEMATKAGLSSTHFNRRFQQLLRCTPSDYLRTIRVQAGCRMLSASHEPIAEIAICTGFTDQSHFTRTFQQSTGITPRAYRLRFQKE
jgi:AraC-like DNA-binding protein